MSTVMWAMSFTLDVEHAGLGLELERLAAGLAGDEPPDAAHAVAAGFRLRAVGIVDADVGLGAGMLGIVQHHHLVEMRRRPCRNRMGRRRRERLLAAAQVDHHDLVAESVHFAEGQGALAWPLIWRAGGAAQSRPGTTHRGKMSKTPS